MTELARLRAEVSTGIPARSLRAGLLASKTTMDTLQARWASDARRCGRPGSKHM
ncbi:MAG TPA: hypothetical protein VGQ05_21830 [Streptosporangiaceae bacterium]|jgi:hypothetical protein|nr:hypothetical protein [Streptosporangiaceae bacterium]